MSWESLLHAQRIKRHKTSRQELADLRNVVERDCGTRGLKFYRLTAVSPLPTTPCSNWQKWPSPVQAIVSPIWGTIRRPLALELAMGRSVSDLAAYFDTCRRKRNQVDYDLAHAVTETEMEELIENAKEFRRLVEQWISKHYHHYAI